MQERPAAIGINQQNPSPSLGQCDSEITGYCRLSLGWAGTGDQNRLRTIPGSILTH
jgi:hypothetical protein